MSERPIRVDEYGDGVYYADEEGGFIVVPVGETADVPRSGEEMRWYKKGVERALMMLRHRIEGLRERYGFPSRDAKAWHDKALDAVAALLEGTNSFLPGEPPTHGSHITPWDQRDATNSRHG